MGSLAPCGGAGVVPVGHAGKSRVLADRGGVLEFRMTVEGKEGNSDPRDQVSPTSTSNPMQPREACGGQ